MFGRIGDMIEVQGERVSEGNFKNYCCNNLGNVQMHPAQIESVFESFEGIKAACALNISSDTLAVLCLKSSRSLRESLTEEELVKEAAIKLPNINFAGGIHIVDEIPRTITNSRKIHRNDARKLAMKLIESNNLIL